MGLGLVEVSRDESNDDVDLALLAGDIDGEGGGAAGAASAAGDSGAGLLLLKRAFGPEEAHALSTLSTSDSPSATSASPGGPDEVYEELHDSEELDDEEKVGQLELDRDLALLALAGGGAT